MAQNYVLLERIELNASAASVTFSNIPQSGYTDLKVVYSARSDAATTDRGMFIRFNGDTASNYTYKFLRGDGSSAGSGGSTTTFLYFGNFNAATSTSNTFGNGEFYIPNYTGSTQKSVSSDSVSENNATSAWTTLVAGLWTGTSAISTILLYPEGGNFVANSTFSLYALAAVGTTPAIAPKATGGNITTDGTYWIHTFNTTGAFVPATNLTCDYLVVAGGGGGGYANGAGGGAGGYRTSVGTSGGGGSAESAISVTNATSYTITVGAGGAAGTSGSYTNSGSNSVFSTITSIGGGGGGTWVSGGGSNNSAGQSGGSGGGGSIVSGTDSGGAGTSNQGYAGSFGYITGNAGSGGGGGAASTGGASSSGQGGSGGAGISSSITGTAVSRAGGGGGSGGGGTGAGGAATAGGGGGANGASPTTFASPGTKDATTNTGGGGGGGFGSGGFPVGNGGSGVVIIRYTIA